MRRLSRGFVVDCEPVLCLCTCGFLGQLECTAIVTLVGVDSEPVGCGGGRRRDVGRTTTGCGADDAGLWGGPRLVVGAVFNRYQRAGVDNELACRVCGAPPQRVVGARVGSSGAHRQWQECTAIATRGWSG